MDIFTIIGLLVVALLIVLFIETETYGALGAIVILTLGYFAFTIGVIPMITWIYSNIGFVITLMAVYTMLGVGWSFFKWDRTVSKSAKRWIELGSKEENKKFYILDWTEHKARISGWIIGWPFSMIGYIFGDMLRELTNFIIKQFGNIYTMITMRHFK